MIFLDSVVQEGEMVGMTIRELARQVGYAPSTVSAALRNRADIALSTRQRIQAAARAAGYVVEPEMRMLMNRMRMGRGREMQAGLGLVIPHQVEDDWSRLPWNRELFKGASEAGARLGFSLDMIAEDRVRRGRADFQRLMRNRNLRGLIYDGAVSRETLELEWLADVPSVILSTQPWVEFMPSICADFTYNIRLALNQLTAAGYERMGLALLESHLRYSEHLMESQYAWWQGRERPEKDRLPLLVYNWSDEGRERECLMEWVEEWRPEVIIMTDNRWKAWLETLGKRVPDELGLVHLNLADDVTGWSGIDQQRGLMGSLAVETLSGLLDRGQTGRSLPASQFVRGAWRSGVTTL
jgi:LacI family transcriptional regulator